MLKLNCQCRVTIKQLGNLLFFTIERNGLLPTSFIVNRLNLYIPSCQSPLMGECQDLLNTHNISDEFIAILSFCCDKFHFLGHFRWDCSFVIEYADGTFSDEFTFDSQSEFCEWATAQLLCTPCGLIEPPLLDNFLPAPLLSITASGASIVENGNCNDPAAIKYGYIITGSGGVPVIDTTATPADIATVQNNIGSDLNQLVTGGFCPKILSTIEIKVGIGETVTVSQGANVIASGIDPYDPASLALLLQAIEDYIAINDPNSYIQVGVAFINGNTLTINILSTLNAFSVTISGKVNPFDESTTHGILKPCKGCYDVTIYATPCDGTPPASVQGNSVSYSVVPFTEPSNDDIVHFIDGIVPHNVVSPYSGLPLGMFVSITDILNALNNDPAKPAGVSFLAIVGDDTVGSYVTTTANSCADIPNNVSAEPVMVEPRITGQQGGGSEILADVLGAPIDGSVEYKIGYYDEIVADWAETAYTPLTTNNITQNYGTPTFGNGTPLRICARYVGSPASEVCDVKLVPKPVVFETIPVVFGTDPYIKNIVNQAPDAHPLFVKTKFAETVRFIGHKTADGIYNVPDVDDQTQNAPPLPNGVTVNMVSNNEFEFEASGAFLADNTGSIEIAQDPIGATNSYSDGVTINAVEPAFETYQYVPTFKVAAITADVALSGGNVMFKFATAQFINGVGSLDTTQTGDYTIYDETGAVILPTTAGNADNVFFAAMSALGLPKADYRVVFRIDIGIDKIEFQLWFTYDGAAISAQSSYGANPIAYNELTDSIDVTFVSATVLNVAATSGEVDYQDNGTDEITGAAAVANFTINPADLVIGDKEFMKITWRTTTQPAYITTDECYKLLLITYN